MHLLPKAFDVACRELLGRALGQMASKKGQYENNPDNARTVKMRHKPIAIDLEQIY